MREIMQDFVPATEPYCTVVDAGERHHQIERIGTVHLNVKLNACHRTTMTMKNVNYVPSFNYNLASWKKASVVYDSVVDEQCAMVRQRKWQKKICNTLENLGTPTLEGTMIMPQQQSTCHKAESEDLTDAQRSEVLEVDQANGHIPISRLQQAVTRGHLHHSSRSVYRLLSNTAFDLSTAIICEPCIASNQTGPSFPRSSDTRFS
jgi:hypothetical protein